MTRAKAELVDGLYVLGDLAYTPEEWARRERDNARRKRNHARWRAANPERARELNREHMRRTRLGEYRKLQVTGSLHSLKCTGPSRATGCRCKKTLIVREVEK